MSDDTREVDNTHAQASDDDSRFRRTLVRVLSVQIVTLVLLWIMQQHFSS